MIRLFNFQSEHFVVVNPDIFCLNYIFLSDTGKWDGWYQQHFMFNGTTRIQHSQCTTKWRTWQHSVDKCSLGMLSLYQLLLIHLLSIYSFTHSLAHSLIHLFINLLIFSLIHSFIYLFIHLFIDPFTHASIKFDLCVPYAHLSFDMFIFLQAKDIMKDYRTCVAENGGKIVILLEIIKESLNVGEKVLVFRWERFMQLVCNRRKSSCPFMHSFIYPLTHSHTLIHLFINFFHSFTHFFCSFIYHSPIHQLIHPSIHSFVHSLIHVRAIYMWRLENVMQAYESKKFMMFFLVRACQRWV